jgi:hypothetical protein
MYHQEQGKGRTAMKKANHVILGIHIRNRVKQAGQVQKLFTEYGCWIKTRIGLHEVCEGACAAKGLVLLEMVGSPKKADKLASKLRKFKSLDVQKMVFKH